MRPDVSRDYQWQRAFLPEMKRIVGECLIGEAPFEEDARRNTDLIVLRLEAVRVGCRVRRAIYLARYGHEFTIRQDRPSGAQSELEKIVAGWGDYLLYGFADPNDQMLARWCLGSLHAFRGWYASELEHRAGQRPGTERQNHDGSSSFRAFRVADIPGFVTAQHDYRLAVA